MNDQKKFIPQIEATGISEAESVYSKDYYIESALKNLRMTSRTAKGIIDVSASTDKAEKMQAGLSEKDIADQATRNFKEVMGHLFNEKERQFENPGELRLFIEDVARRINAGLTKQDVLIRSGEDSTKFPYTKIKNLESAMQQFYEKLLQKLNDSAQDPKEIAAFVEYHIDLKDHFFADGCGKAAKSISAWVLMQRKMPLPRYRSRDEYYENARLKNPTGDLDADEHLQWVQWLNYYKTLFEK